MAFPKEDAYLTKRLCHPVPFLLSFPNPNLNYKIVTVIFRVSSSQRKVTTLGSPSSVLQ